MLFPPANFQFVEDLLYRAALPSSINVPFLETLDIKTLVVLESVQGSETLDPIVQAFLDDNDVCVARIGSDPESGSSTNSASAQTMSEELVLAAMRLIVDEANYPILIVDSLGKHRTGVLVACVRKLQRWSLSSIFEE